MATRRNNLRYPDYDYRQPGAYFVTLCTYQRQRLFGVVAGGIVVLSSQGLVTECHWRGIPDRFPGVVADACVVMPDHLHGVLFLGTDPALPCTASVADIVRWFKNSVLAEYRQQVATGTWEPYAGKLWQRHYHDRIVRSERELEQIRLYIEANPARWQARQEG